MAEGVAANVTSIEPGVVVFPLRLSYVKVATADDICRLRRGTLAEFVDLQPAGDGSEVAERATAGLHGLHEFSLVAVRRGWGDNAVAVA